MHMWSKMLTMLPRLPSITGTWTCQNQVYQIHLVYQLVSGLPQLDRVH